MSNIPYTTAASDFLKLVEFKEDSKSDLIDFAATDFITLRTALVNYVKAVYPLDYNSFAESDLGMMMIELIAYMGSVMSMKADMLAHENFIKTAKNPVNIRKLLQLIGIKSRGPASAAAQTSVVLADGQEISSGNITVPVSNRVFNVTSPVDNQAVTYTLYKTVNGQIDDIGSSNDISLEYAEADAGKTWENLVLVEGALVVETGTFADVDVIKTVSLNKGPIVDGSVQVYINTGDAATSQAYKEVQSLLSTSSSDDAVFELSYNSDFTATVLFGDGVTGKLPPTGSTYTVLYRVGGGIRGNAAAGLIQQNKNTAGGKEITVTNTLPFTGGASSESIEHIKKYSKLVFRQQDRLVSLDDYTAFGNTFKSSTGSSGKAIASTRKAFGSGNIVDVFVVEKASDTQLQKASIAFKTDMLEKMEDKKMITDQIALVDGLVRTVDLNIEVTLDRRFETNEGTIKSRVVDVVLNYFNVDNREFGEDFFPEEVARDIFTEVSEVRVARVTNYDQPLPLEFNEILQLNNVQVIFNYV